MERIYSVSQAGFTAAVPRSNKLASVQALSV